MNRTMLIGAIVVMVVLLGGLLLLQGRNSQIQEQRTTTNLPASQTKEEGQKIAGYEGMLLAGKSGPYLTFTKTDYEKAKAAGKIIVLDFYANWCPVCRSEAPELKAGFDSLTTDKVIGFRVNYNDSDTDEDEKALAKEFGIVYQHTKVILKNGKEVLKSGDSWDKDTFAKAINNLLQ